MSNNLPERSSRLHLPLLVGDLIAIVVFTAVGMAEHRQPLGVIAVLVTAVPFLIVWPLVSFWLGALRLQSVETIIKSVTSIIFPWILTMPIALQLRVLLLKRGAPIIFALVAFISGWFFLAAWRIIYSIISAKKKAA